MTEAAKALHEKIIELLEKHSYYSFDRKNDCIRVELYADYRDEASVKTVVEWCKSNHPMDAFYESLFDWYLEAKSAEENELLGILRVNWNSKRFPFEENEEFITDWLRDHVEYVYPEEHYLSQTVCVDIIVDTGDANYDFVLNDVYPHYDGRYEEKIPEEASILWLARQQGYNKRRLNAAMKKGEFGGNKLLKSLRNEVLNCSSHMNALTFMIQMTVRELFDLQEKIREEQKKDKRQMQGTVTIGKEAACGLYDTWSGAGSVFEIELEKDVELPVWFISSALPDGEHCRSIRDMQFLLDAHTEKDRIRKRKMNTKIMYMYRDVAGYKIHCEEVVSGEISEADRTEILENAEWTEFYPANIGFLAPTFVSQGYKPYRPRQPRAL